MQQFFIALFEYSVAMSVISLIYIIAGPFLSKRYTAKWLYYGWLVLVIGWIFPFRPQLNSVFLPTGNPVVQVISTQYINLGESFMISVSNKTNTASYVSIWWLGICIWAVGMTGMIAYHIWRHKKFLKMVSRWSEDITNLQTLDTLKNLKKEMNIVTYVGLKFCSCITSPMMIGFFRPVILLPPTKFNSNDLTYVLRHELIHLKRKDLWYKILVLLATAIHWFNPTVYLMAKAIAAQCEISCDELLLKGTRLHQRQEYGKIIINAIKGGTKHKTTLSTNFYGGKRDMETRIRLITDTRKRKTGIIVLCIILIGVMSIGPVFAVDSIKDSMGKQESNGELEIPPYSEYGEGKTMAEDLADLGFLEYDEVEHVHRFNGRWVRTINDRYIWNGEQYGGLSSIPGNYSGDPVDLKTVRNSETNIIESVVEMTETETHQALNYRPAWLEKALKNFENLTIHKLQIGD